jgi:hypothetical protein
MSLDFPSICSQKKSTSQLYPAEMDPSHAAAKRIELYSGSEARNFGLMPHFTSEQRQQFVFVTVRCAQLGSGSVGRCKTQRMDLRPALSFFEGILQISTIITSWQTFPLIMRVLGGILRPHTLNPYHHGPQKPEELRRLRHDKAHQPREED